MTEQQPAEPVFLTTAAAATSLATQATAAITSPGFTVTTRSLDEANDFYAVHAQHTDGYFYEISDANLLPAMVAACNSH